MYRDTYRIMTQVSRYVSHREIRYRDNTTPNHHKLPQTTTRIWDDSENDEKQANHRKPKQTTANLHQNTSKNESNFQLCGLNTQL